MNNFALKTGDGDFETKVLHYACVMEPDTYSIKRFNRAEDVPSDYITFGNIDWVTDCLGKVPTPDYYPDFVKHLLRRKVWKEENWPMHLKESVFIKPFDKPKRYQHIITRPGSYKGKKKGPHWCSEIIKFGNEWRLYVQDGRIVYSGWYYPEPGPDVSCPQEYIDEIQDCIPSGWCGSIDIGEYNGKLTLVECGEPYGTGFYGPITDGKIYADWSFAGWKWIKEHM